MSRLRRFAGAVLLGGLGLIYMIVSLATGHSARAELPPDFSLRAGAAGLDAWKAAGALIDNPGAVLVDVRGATEFARWHAPGSLSAPEADAAPIRALLGAHPLVIVVAARDEAARKLVGEARAAEDDLRVFYLADGARAWYMAFELPAPMFSEAPPPLGYDEALAAVRGYLASPDAARQAAARDGLGTLIRLNVQPTLLKQKGKSAPAGGAKRKKISGGCG